MQWYDFAIAAGYFVIGCFSDGLGVAWHSAREDGKAILAANLGILIAILNWIPLVLLVVNENWLVLVADSLGAWVGTYWGVSVYRKEPTLD